MLTTSLYFYNLSIRPFFPPPPPVCEDSWSVFPGIATLGGVFSSVESQAACRSLCVADPGCVAVDISNGSPFFCFIHNNDSLTHNEPYNSEFIAQHRLDRRCLGKVIIDWNEVVW